MGTGNFSRNTFDKDTFNKLKNYVSVRLQQGVPLVDADWNEKDDIRRFEIEAFLKWFVGNGVPCGNDGFRIEPVSNLVYLTARHFQNPARLVIEVDLAKSTAANGLGFGPDNFKIEAFSPPSQLTGKQDPIIIKDANLLALRVKWGSGDYLETTLKLDAAKGADTVAIKINKALEGTGLENVIEAGCVKASESDLLIRGGDGKGGAGICLVEGWEIYNFGDVLYSKQPMAPPTHDSRFIAYLVGWEQLVDPEEDPELEYRGVRSCVRIKRAWAVRPWQDEDPLPGHVFYPIAELAWIEESWLVKDLRRTGLAILDKSITIRDGKVGIGTTSPQYSLDVCSSVGIKLGLEGNGGGRLIVLNDQNDNSIYLEAFSNGQVDRQHADLLAVTGRATENLPRIALHADQTDIRGNVATVGEVAVAGGYKTEALEGPSRLHIGTQADWNAPGASPNHSQIWWGDNTGWKLHFGTKATDGTFKARMTLVDEGNVGIGTVTPANLLDVAGNMAIGSDLAGISTVPENGLAVQGGISVGYLGHPNLGYATTISVGAEVARTYPPELEHQKTVYGWNLKTYGLGWDVFAPDEGPYAGLATGTSGVECFSGMIPEGAGHNEERVVQPQACITTDGLFGIGTNNPQFKLHVDGDIFATGNIYQQSTLAEIRFTDDISLASNQYQDFDQFQTTIFLPVDAYALVTIFFENLTLEPGINYVRFRVIDGHLNVLWEQLVSFDEITQPLTLIGPVTLSKGSSILKLQWRGGINRPIAKTSGLCSMRVSLT